ncbi:tetratricopeptide repeat protein, partial [Candidatus Pacearchaeota archaeon]|nr:tetratricopeptide repeat protein [Candidatus Pacearchaeota archaeon]
IKELEAIVKNPEEETKKIISEKEGEIDRLEKELSQIDQKKEKIKLLQEQLEEEQKRHKELKNEFRKFKRTRDAKKLSQKASLTKKKSWQTQVLNEGMDLRNKGQLEEAIAIFTELIEKDHSYSRAYYQRAFCFRDLGFFEIALADLNRALELNPKDKKAYSNRGLVYRRLMDFEHAINDLDKALKLDPNDITILMNKAEILIIAGKAIEAEKTTREALNKAELIEHQAVGHYLLAISLKLQRKSTKKVNAELERLLNLNFQTAWTFTETEIWLKKEAISKEIKNYIQEKTKMLKKHRKRSRKSSGK